MAKVVRFHEIGPAEVLKIEDLPQQEPKENEVRLRVEALGLNRAEVMFRKGQYLENPQLPARLGYEAAGVVDAVGPGVTAFKAGDRVSTIPAFSMNAYGVYGESVVVPIHAVAHYPKNLSPFEGTSIWMQYLTAWGGLIYRGGLQPKQHVLITAASSSVGLAAIELVKLAGAYPIAVTRTSAKKQSLLDFGAEAVIASEEEDLPAIIEKLTSGKGVELVFDPIGGPFIETLAKACAPGAQIIEYGALSPEPTPFPLFLALQKGLAIRGYVVWEVTANPELRPKGERYIYEQLEQGKLKPKIDRVFPFSQIVEAHKYMESNQQNGKIVIDVRK